MSKLFLHTVFVIICGGATVMADVKSSNESLQHPGSLLDDTLEEVKYEGSAGQVK